MDQGKKSFKVSLLCFFFPKAPFISVDLHIRSYFHHLIFSVSTGTISIGLVEETTTAGGPYSNIVLLI